MTVFYPNLMYSLEHEPIDIQAECLYASMFSKLQNQLLLSKHICQLPLNWYQKGL